MSKNSKNNRRVNNPKNAMPTSNVRHIDPQTGNVVAETPINNKNEKETAMTATNTAINEAEVTSAAEAIVAIAQNAQPTETAPKAEKAQKASKKATENADGKPVRSFALVANSEEHKLLFCNDIRQIMQRPDFKASTCTLYDALRDELGWKKLPGSIKFRAYTSEIGLLNYTMTQKGKRTLTSVALADAIQAPAPKASKKAQKAEATA